MIGSGAAFDLVAGRELEAGQPAERGDVLVLLADLLLEQVDLDVAGLLGQLARVDQVLLVGVERLQQRGREAAGRAEAGAGRDVGHAGDLQRAAVDLHQAHRLADDRVLELVGRWHPLQAGVLDDQVVDERVVDRDVDILVDRAGDQEAAELLVVGGEVGAAAPQRDPQRATRDNHGRTPRTGARRSPGRPGRRRRCRSGCARSRCSPPSARPRACQERSSRGYSQAVVSGGPISGSIR